MPPRQTVSYLRQRFAELGLQPDSKHGQNFLIDLNLINMLADNANITPNDVVLEVGTGTGSLTAMLAKNAAAVVTVEIDSHLHMLASEALEECDNVIMLLQDALKNKNNIHAVVLDAVREQLAIDPNRRFKFAANLPYNVATPLISNLLASDIPPDLMCVTIQKELAERIVAEPHTKDYSALSVWVQSQCDARIVRIMGPSVFWPRPKVHSAIIQIKLNPEKRARIPDIDYFHTFVRSLFLHRRKFLRGVLLANYKKILGKDEIDAIMAEFNFGPTSRAEELSVDSMIQLCEAVRARVPAN